jgi:hypothetical protein
MLKKITVLIISFVFFNSVPVPGQNVRIVENGKEGKWGKSPKIKLNFIGKIGDLNETNKNLMFQKPQDFTIDKDGNTFITDAGFCRIQKYDKNFKFVASFGKKGPGPGEFLNPGTIDVDKNGFIYVYDIRKGAILVLNNSGKQIKTINFPEFDIDFRIMSDGKFMYKNPRLSLDRPSKTDIPLIYYADDRGKTIKTIGIGPDLAKKTGKRRAGAYMLGFTIDQSNNIYTSYIFQNKIEKYSFDGKLLMSISRELNSSLLSDIKGFTSSQLSEAIAVDGKGRIWALTAKRKWRPMEMINDMYIMDPNSKNWTNVPSSWPKNVPYFDKGDLYVLELFDTDGTLLYKFQMDRFFRQIKIFKNRIYLLDPRHTASVYVYEISDL